MPKIVLTFFVALYCQLGQAQSPGKIFPKLRVGEKTYQTVSLSTLLLAPYFRAMFGVDENGEAQYPFEESIDKEIVIDYDYDSDSFDMIVKFLRTGVRPAITDPNRKYFVEALNFFGLPAEKVVFATGGYDSKAFKRRDSYTCVFKGCKEYVFNGTLETIPGKILTHFVNDHEYTFGQDLALLEGGVLLRVAEGQLKEDCDDESDDESSY